MGNPYAKGTIGNKGGGRPSAYKERQDAEWHEDVWKNEQDKSILDAKIESGKYSGREMALKKLLDGNDRIVAKFMDKLVPDLVNNRIVDKNGNDVYSMEDLAALRANVRKTKK